MRRTVAAGAAILLAGAMVGAPHFSSAQTPDTWPTFHADSTRDGVSPVSGTTSMTAVNEFQVGSSVQSSIPSSPVVDAHNVAYVGSGDNGTVSALDPHSPGAAKWVFSTKSHVSSTPSLSPDGSRLYFGADNGNMYALNTSDGKQIWSVNLGTQIIASPLVSTDGSTIYVPTVEGTLFGLHSSDGSTAWTFSPGGAMIGSPAASPDGTTIYVAGGRFLYALPSSGPSASHSASEFFLDDIATSSPAVDANGNIYVGTASGILDSFSPTKVAPQWTYTVPDYSPLTSTPAVFNGLVYFGEGNKDIQAVSQSTGSPAFNSGPVHTGGPVLSSPAVASGNKMVYIGSKDGNIYALDATGHVVFKRNIGIVDSSPALGPDGSLWVVTRGGTLYHLAVLPPPATIPPAPSTTTPQATSTAAPTSTAVATSIPTATATATPSQILLSISLKSSVKAGSKQTITVTSAAGTDVHLRVDYPNGDHQSKKVTTDASGTATYTYKQAASKITHKNFTATVTAQAGTGATANTATETYRIGFAKLDVSAEPRKQSVGKVVDIFVHAAAKSHVTVFLLVPNGRLITLQGTTGHKGFASIKYKIPKGLVSGKKRTVVVLARFKGGKPNVSTKTKFTVK